MTTIPRKFGAAAAIAVLACGWAGSQGPKSKPAPTTFPKRTEDAFFKDVVRQHGEGTYREVFWKRADPARQADGSVAWSKIIPADALRAEITAATHAVAPHLDSPAKWRAGHQQVRQLLSTLVVCFGVIEQYDGKVAFQKEARVLREALAECSEHCRAANESSLLEARQRLKELTTLVGGGAVKLPAAKTKEGKAWGALELPQVMKRIERGFAPADAGGGLDRWTANAKEFKAAKAMVAHEAQMLGMLAKVVQDPNAFDQASDAEFAKFALHLETASAEIAAAAKADNYDAARAAAGSVTETCAGCHAAFR